MTEQDYLKKGFALPFLWLDFVNSFERNGLGASAEHLTDPRWRKAFLRHWKLRVPASARVPLPALLRLRVLLRRAAQHFSSPAPVSPADLRALNRTLSVVTRRHLFQHQNGFALLDVPQANDWQWVQAQIAASFAQSLLSSPRDRVKICPDPLCDWIFYDTTRGRTRLWCNERTCGNRNRVRRARAAHAS